jgi:telomere length regulation protein
LETQEWVGNVFERVGGGSEEGDRVRMLAAGVLMRTREVVERYQRMLMGDLVDFM